LKYCQFVYLFLYLFILVFSQALSSWRYPVILSPGRPASSDIATRSHLATTNSPPFEVIPPPNTKLLVVGITLPGGDVVDGKATCIVVVTLLVVSLPGGEMTVNRPGC